MTLSRSASSVTAGGALRAYIINSLRNQKLGLRVKSDDTYSPEETEQRLRKTLRAAFNMKPTPLKAIPKRNGEARRTGARQPKKSA